MQRADRLLVDLKETQSCSSCAHLDTIPDCDCECLGCSRSDCPCKACTNYSKFKWRGDSGDQFQTNGDRLRQHTDEELVELLYQHYLSFADRDGAEDPSVKWCDLQGGCKERENANCTEAMHKACILRWLRMKAGGADGA